MYQQKIDTTEGAAKKRPAVSPAPESQLGALNSAAALPMKMRLLSFFFLMMGVSGFAMPVVVSSSLNVSAEGYAGVAPNQGGGGQSYSDQQSLAVTPGAGGATVSGTAAWSNPTDPGFAISAVATAASSANAATQLAVGAQSLDLSYSGSLQASIGGFVGGPVMSEHGKATQSLSFVFSLDELSRYDFAFSYDGMHGHGLFPSAPQVSFTSLSGGAVVDLSGIRVGPGQWSFTGSGVLAPGSYRLSTDFITNVGGDPLGDFESGVFKTSLATQAIVPDAGSSVLMFAGVVVGIALLRRRRRAR